jgi:hypothetical protein
MQCLPVKSRPQHGAIVLLVMVSLSVILGLITTGYMLLITSQHRLVSQSMEWNTALTMAEAGIEEGLAQININYGTNYVGSAMTNWTYTGSSFGPVTRTLSNGSYSAVIMLGGGPCPSIIATGYAAQLYNLPPVKRVVQVTTTNWSPFQAAMTVQYNFDSKGSGITLDSYDSSDPNHSTNGMYDASTRMAGGDIASLWGPVTIQGATVYGKLRIGPLASYSIGNGSVGDLTWNTPGAIEAGWFENDFNATFRDVDPPFTSGFPVVPVNIGTNTYILSTGDYYVGGDFTINNNETLYINGNTRLYVTGNFNMKAQNASFISMAPGASLKLYIGQPGGTPVAATFAQVNNSGAAISFSVYGLPTLTTMTWNGNTAFVGNLYAPEADLSLGGGGSTIYDYQGSLTVRSVGMNGHFNFHYDQNLARAVPGTGFLVTGWQEL